MTTRADPSDMSPPPLSTRSATQKIAFFRVLNAADDDHLMNKCRNAIVLTRVELSSKDGSTHVKLFTLSLLL